MNKIIMEDIFIENENEWIFPKIELSIQPNDKKPQEKNKIIDNENQNEHIEKMIIENQAKKLEIEMIKAEYEKKIAIVDNMLKQLERPLSVIDDDLIEIINQIIKKTVKNLIYKEIKSDPKLLIKIINTLSESIQEKGGLITIYLSQSDYNRLFDEAHNLNLRVDSSLVDGDLIIKSNKGEIHSLLNERIDRVIRCKR
ncbi:FliH/SctL family protein [Aquicella lusitana]|uniref:Flagellar biosynthesis/type III secretory pathway protein FliH n=1 Tax=Aquicella lusitana TaxID=254246 RepID=A0A370G3U8_9COXI|nr:FliH/SctL family protein [Aquicella lusitana]RDI38531.1 flagellar biosynthesis/type III secretory pathway protein FliH [Aquicella lusitana]VVC74624.1 hypothetical protein AQULUS_23900 [Aquicella lusitana]